MAQLTKRIQTEILRNAILRLHFHRTVTLKEESQNALIEALVEYGNATALAEQADDMQAWSDAHEALRSATV